MLGIVLSVAAVARLKKIQVPCHLALLDASTCSFPDSEYVDCFSYTEELLSSWSRGCRVTFSVRGHTKVSPIQSLNTTGVVIILFPLRFPHRMAGFKQAHETEVMKVKGCWRKHTFEICKYGLSLWHIQRNQHLFRTDA